MKKYFVRTLILLACWSQNSVILAFGCDKNPHVVNVFVPFRFKTRDESNAANISGFKEGKVKTSAGLRKFHYDVWVKHRKNLLFTSNTKSWKYIFKRWINVAWNKWRSLRGRSNSSTVQNFRDTVKPPRPQPCLIFYSILSVNLLGYWTFREFGRSVNQLKWGKK